MSKKMLKPTDKKNVIIKDMGPITVLGNISGPILKPFPVKVSDLLHLVVTKYHVFEVLSDGKEVRLTVDNYNKSNKPEPANTNTDNSNVDKESGFTGTNKSDSNNNKSYNNSNNKDRGNDSNKNNNFYQKNKNNTKEEQK